MMRVSALVSGVARSLLKKGPTRARAGLFRLGEMSSPILKLIAAKVGKACNLAATTCKRHSVGTDNPKEGIQRMMMNTALKMINPAQKASRPSDDGPTRVVAVQSVKKRVRDDDGREGRSQKDESILAEQEPTPNRGGPSSTWLRPPPRLGCHCQRRSKVAPNPETDQRRPALVRRPCS